MSAATTVVGALTQARDLLANVGWIRYRWFDTDNQGCKTGFCAVGAIGEAVGAYDRTPPAGWTDVYTQATNFLVDAAREITGDVTTGPISYNDKGSTTKADVLAMYDRAIEMAGAAA